MLRPQMAMIDTFDTAKTLEKQGFTESQAEGLAHALKRAITEEIPTRNDFAELLGDFGGRRGESAGPRAGSQTCAGISRTSRGRSTSWPEGSGST